MKTNTTPKIYLASDHAGYEMKQELKSYLESNYDFNILDFGASDYDELDDYPDYMHKAGEALQQDIVNDISSIAFVFGGSGEGEAMVMNRYAGVRCTTYYGGNLDIIKIGREHNDANSVSFGARFLDISECIASIELFLATVFLEGKHQRRVEKIDIN